MNGWFEGQHRSARRCVGLGLSLTLLLPSLALAQYNMSIMFGGYAGRTGPLTNFPALVIFSNNVGGSGFSFSNTPFLSPNGYDLRFQDATGSNLNYEIETWNTNRASFVWVQVPTLSPDGSSYIMATWGDVAASSQLPCTTNGSTWDAPFHGVWHMAQTNALDSTTNGNNGVAATNLNATGLVDGCQQFNGNAQINCGHGASLNVTTNLSVSAWIKSNENDLWGVFVGKGSDSDYELEFPGSTTQVRMRINNITQGGAAPQGAITPNVWTYVAGTYNGQTAILYLNGVLAASNALTTTWAPSSKDLILGHRADKATYYYNGLLDEVRVDSVPRSADWVWAAHRTVASNAVFASYSPAVASGAPLVSVTTPFAVTPTTASLIGTLFSTGTSATHVFALWGPSDGSGTWNGWANTNDLGFLSAGPLNVLVSNLTQTTRYYCTFVATNNSGVTFAAPSVSFVTQGGAVIDTVGGASNVTAWAATLNGTLTVTNAPNTHVFALLGPTNAGASWAGWTLTNDVRYPSVGPLAVPVTGLAATSTWYYTFVATNAMGATWAPAPATFTTLVAAVIDNGGGAGNVTATSATLNGTLKGANAPQTHVFLLWGQTNAGATWNGWANVTDLGPSSPAPLATFVSGLSAASGYYYEYVASNAAGTVWASPAMPFNTRLDAVSSFRYRMPITFPGYAKSETLTNFPVLVVLSPGPGGSFDYSQCASTNGWDVRFASSADPTHTLNHDIERWTLGGSSHLWVQVPQLTSNTWIWAYWGNSSLTSTPPAFSATWMPDSLATWHLSDTAAPFRDASAYRNVCGGSAPPTFVTNGWIAGAQQFSGAQYLTNQTGAINLGSHFTVSTWVNATSGNVSRTILSTRHIGADSGISFYVNAWGTGDGTLVFEGANATTSVTTNRVPAGEWHHVAAVVNAAGSTASLYVDGVNCRNNGPIGAVDSNRTVFIGSFNDGQARHVGLLDELRIDSLERSSNWIWATWFNAASNQTFTAFGPVTARLPGSILVIQ